MDPAGRGESCAGQTAQDQRDQVAEQSQLQDAATQPVDVDLEAGQEEQESEAEQRDDLHREIDVDEAEAVRPEDDAGHDLEDHGRDPQPRRESEQERCQQRDQHDGEQVSEMNSRHDGSALIARKVAEGIE